MDDVYRYYGLSAPPFVPADAAGIVAFASRDDLVGEIAAEIGEGRTIATLGGERGVGKSTLLLQLAAALRDLRHTVIAIPAGPARPADIQAAVDAALGTQLQRAVGPYQLMKALEGRGSLVLLFDDAESLPEEALQFCWLLIRLLDVGTTTLHLVLAGSLGRWPALDSPDLVELRQRAGWRAIMRPLTDEESADYLTERLVRAGQPARRVLSRAAMAELLDQAFGLPGEIGTMAEAALAHGHRIRRRPVTRRAVLEALSPESPLDDPLLAAESISIRPRWKDVATGAFMVAGIAIATASMLHYEFRDSPVGSEGVARTLPNRFFADGAAPAAPGETGAGQDSPLPSAGSRPAAIDKLAIEHDQAPDTNALAFHRGEMPSSSVRPGSLAMLMPGTPGPAVLQPDEPGPANSGAAATAQTPGDAAPAVSGPETAVPAGDDTANSLAGPPEATVQDAPAPPPGGAAADALAASLPPGPELGATPAETPAAPVSGEAAAVPEPALPASTPSPPTIADAGPPAATGSSFPGPPARQDLGDDSPATLEPATPAGVASAVSPPAAEAQSSSPSAWQDMAAAPSEPDLVPSPSPPAAEIQPPSLPARQAEVDAEPAVPEPSVPQQVASASAPAPEAAPPAGPPGPPAPQQATGVSPGDIEPAAPRATALAVDPPAIPDAVLVTPPAPAPQAARPNAAKATARRRGGPGLALLAQSGDTVQALYSRVYQGLTPPPYEEVAAINRAPLRPGTIVVFPEPPGGWTRR